MERFRRGQRIMARRSGRGTESIAEILEDRLAELTEGIYRVRWDDGVETYYVPGRDAHDRRLRDEGPPPGVPERRRAGDPGL